MFDTATTTKATSAQAFDSVSLGELKYIQDEIEHIVRSACSRGVPDLSLREIQHRYESATGRRIELSTVSSRVNSLVCAKRLQRPGEPRACSITGRNILPVRPAGTGV